MFLAHQALDRDKPGIPSYQVRVGAQDEDGASTSQKEYFELVINLTDINDNPPYLEMVSRLSGLATAWCWNSELKLKMFHVAL